MSLKSTIALMLLLAMADGVQADLRGTAIPPTFTQEEMEIIRRNVALAAVVAEDPWLVRQFLDGLIASRKDGAARQKQKPSGAATENPDLEGLERASPEALHDLIQRLKQAAGNSQGDKK